MARRSIPSFSELWQKHEALYINIFIMALQKLAFDKCDTNCENIISERLNPILNSVCFEECKKRKCEIRVPDWETTIPPKTESELKKGNYKKRPDFTCNLTNSLASSSDEYEIPFHVECKRLGVRPSRNWILNKNYVVNALVIGLPILSISSIY